VTAFPDALAGYWQSIEISATASSFEKVVPPIRLLTARQFRQSGDGSVVILSLSSISLSSFDLDLVAPPNRATNAQFERSPGFGQSQRNAGNARIDRWIRIGFLDTKDTTEVQYTSTETVG
jgi:hypothetical protein